MISQAKHPGNIGSARESLVASFLKSNLPEYIKYSTGEVIDYKGNNSGQIDLVLYPITSPKFNLHDAINIFPAESVLATIEVKSYLSTGKANNGALNKTLNSCKKPKQLRLNPINKIFTHSIDSETVPYILFAFKGPKLNTLLKKLKDKNRRGLPDLIVVLKHNYYLEKNSDFFYAGTEIKDIYTLHEKCDCVLLGMFTYLLKSFELWSRHPDKHFMPVDSYVENLQGFF